MSMSAKVVMMARQQNYDAKIHAMLKDVVPSIVPNAYIDHLSFVSSQGGKTRYNAEDLPATIDLDNLGDLFRDLSITGDIVQVEVVLDLDAVKQAVEKQTNWILGR